MNNNDNEEGRYYDNEESGRRKGKYAQHQTQDIGQPVLDFSALVADLQHQAGALKGKKGPASPEAKQRVKYNALRHGFTGQVLLMTPEEREKFDAFVKGIRWPIAPRRYSTKLSSPTPWPKKPGG